MRTMISDCDIDGNEMENYFALNYNPNQSYVKPMYNK